MSTETPRERIDWSLKFGVMGTLPAAYQHDIRAVLSANAGYEKIIAEQRREAVAEYKKELAEGLEALKRGETEDGIDMLDNVIDGLKEGSL